MLQFYLFCVYIFYSDVLFYCLVYVDSQPDDEILMLVKMIISKMIFSSMLLVIFNFFTFSWVNLWSYPFVRPDSAGDLP